MIQRPPREITGCSPPITASCLLSDCLSHHADPCPVSLQVNRPLSMKKDGIQTRKRKPKSMGGAHSTAGRPAGPLAGKCRTVQSSTTVGTHHTTCCCCCRVPVVLYRGVMRLVATSVRIYYSEDTAAASVSTVHLVVRGVPQYHLAVVPSTRHVHCALYLLDSVRCHHQGCRITKPCSFRPRTLPITF